MIKKILKLGKQRLHTYNRDYKIDKHPLTYLFWECTLNCNFKCEHCWSSAWEKTIDETLSTQQIKDAFLDISKSFDTSKIMVAITWWEPLLRKDLFEVMTYASSLWFTWWMVSNWYFINNEIVEKLKKSWMKTMDISIDWIWEIHDNFRNMKGSYLKAINAFKLLNEANFINPLRVTTTINKNNINSLDEMYEEFNKLWVKNWRLLNVDPIWRTLCNKNILLDENDFEKLLKFMKKKRNKNSPTYITYWCAHYLWEELENEVRWNFFYCWTWIEIWSILHNWDIFVCPNVPRHKDLIQWNVKNSSFSEIWNNKFEIFRDKDRCKSESCWKCEHWNECLWGSFHSWDYDKKEQKVCLMRDELYKI